MARFKDTNGNEWDVSITTTTIKRLRASSLAVDLLAVVEGEKGKLLERLYLDPIFLVDVVFEVCRPQCEAKGVSDVKFGEAMAGDAIDDATGALIQGLTDFLSRAEDRANLGLIKSKIDAVMKAGMALARSKIEAIDVNVLAEQALQRAGDSSGSVPESSASIPAPSPSSS